MSDLKDLNIFHNEDLKIDFIGAEKLQKMFRTATRSVKAKIEFPKQVSLPKTPKVQEGYIGFIDARQIVSMVTSNEDNEEPSINRSVFYDNIREYNPDAALNEKISESVGHENDGFVYRNVLSSLSGKKAKNLAKLIVDFCADEEKVIPFIKVVMKVIKKVVKAQGWNTREKLRDGIRSESFYLLVRKDLEGHLYE